MRGDSDDAQDAGRAHERVGEKDAGTKRRCVPDAGEPCDCARANGHEDKGESHGFCIRTETDRCGATASNQQRSRRSQSSLVRQGKKTNRPLACQPGASLLRSQNRSRVRADARFLADLGVFEAGPWFSLSEQPATKTPGARVCFERKTKVIL